MTNSPANVLRGFQQPRISCVPPAVSSSGDEAIELCESVGLFLDPWQQNILRGGLGETADGTWSAFEVAAIVARQNGKGCVYEARYLAGLFLFGEQQLLHTAHQFKTARKCFERMLFWIRNNDWLSKRVKQVRGTHGEEGILLRSGAELNFVARSGMSARGFTQDVVGFDEAMFLTSEQIGAALPTLIAVPNAQVWYAGSAGLKGSAHLRQLRKRAIEGGEAAAGLAYFEHSADPGLVRPDPKNPDHLVLYNPLTHKQSNPALGIRITEKRLKTVIGAMPPAEAAREILGIWDDAPSDEDAQWELISEADWAACLDPAAVHEGRIAFGIDTNVERTKTAICAGGTTPDGLPFVEVLRDLPGTGTAIAELLELRERNAPNAPVAIDKQSPAATLIPDLRRRHVDVIETDYQQLANACAGLTDKVDARKLRHRGQQILDLAAGGVIKRELGDRFAFSRKKSTTDIYPLVASALALLASEQLADGRPFNVW